MRLGMGLGLGNLLSGGPITGMSNKYSFNFDGSNDYLDLGDIASNVGYQGTSADDRSYSFWFRASNLTGYRTIFTSGDASNKGVVIYLQSNYIACEIRDGSTRAGVVGDGGGTLSADTWYHVVITFDSSAFSSGNGHNMIKIYVNGSDVTDTSNTAPGLSETASKTFIGHPAVAGGVPLYHIGFVDEFACWNTILSSSDVTKLASKPSDLSKASSYDTDRTSNLKLWLRAGDKVLPEEDASIARADYFCDFDGTDDYVDLGNDSSLQITGALTISAWINTSNTGSIKMIVSKDDDTNRNFHFTINASNYLSGGIFSSGTGYFTTGDVNICDGAWHHVALNFTPSTSVSIYLDGSLHATNTSSIPATIDNDTVNFLIGRLGDGSYDFNGAISNISLHKTALDAQTIKQFAKSRFTPMRDNRFSVVNLDGTNEYIDCGNDSSLALTGAFTISAWFNINSISNVAGVTVLSKGDSGSDRAVVLQAFRLDSSGGIKLSLFLSSDGSNWAVSGLDTGYGTISTGTWHHVVATWNGSTTGKIYLDGVLKDTDTVSSFTTRTTSSNVRIGINSDNGSDFNGDIKSVSVYNEVKSDDEAYAIYQQGITYDESSLSGLQGYWRMGDDTSKAYPTIADSSSNSNDGTITNGASDDIVQQMIAGYDMGAFESTSVEQQVITDTASNREFTNGTTTNWAEFYGSPSGTVAVNDTDDTLECTINGSSTRGGCKLNVATYGIGAVVSGKTYEFSISAKCDDSSNTFRMSFGGLEQDQTLTSSLVTYTLAGTATSDTNEIFLFMTSVDSGALITIDNVSFKEVLQSEVSDTYYTLVDVNEPVLGAELVTNGTMEADSNWSNYNSPTTNERSSEQAHSGTYSRKFITDANYEGIISDGYTTTTGKHYIVSFWIYPASIDSIRVRMQEGDGSGDIATSSGTNPTFRGFTLNAWNQVSFNYQESSGGSSGKIVMESGGETGSNSATYYIDDVTVKELQGNAGKMTNMASSDLVYSSVLPDQSFLVGNSSPYNFIDLDGSNEYILVTSLNSFETSALGTTWSAWIKPTNTSAGERSIVGRLSGVNSTFGAGISHNTTTLIGQASNSGSFDVTSTSTIVAGEWQHVAFTAKDGEQKLYHNGVLKTTATNSTVEEAGEHFAVGAGKWSSTVNSYFNGQIGQVAMWGNKYLSATEISAIYNLGRHGNLLDKYSDNLKGYWAMSALDASTGLSDVGNGTIYDRSGQSNHGTATNTEAADLASSPNADPNGYAKGDTNRSTDVK